MNKQYCASYYGKVIKLLITPQKVIKWLQLLFPKQPSYYKSNYFNFFKTKNLLVQLLHTLC